MTSAAQGHRPARRSRSRRPLRASRPGDGEQPQALGFVNPARLDPGARQLLGRAQAAAGDILASRICRDNVLDTPALAAVLDDGEWELVRLLGEADRLPAARASLLGDDPAAPAPGPQQDILRNVRAAAAELAAAVEACAAQVKAADTAYRQHAAAGPLAALDSRFLELEAATAASRHAGGHVRRLHAEAAAAELVLLLAP